MPLQTQPTHLIVKKEAKPRKSVSNLDESGIEVTVKAPQPMKQTFEQDLMSLYHESQKPAKTGVDEKEQR